MKLGVAIESAYLKARPDRRARADWLKSRLDSFPVHIEDRPARVAITARRCWQHLLAVPGLTHGLVIQDDVTLSDDFADQIVRVLEAIPDQVVVPWYSRPSKAMRVWKRGPGFVRTTGGVWGPAISAPLDIAKAFVDWELRNLLPGPMDDDMRWQLFLLFTGRQAWATVPCLVQHPDPDPAYRQLSDVQGSLGHTYQIRTALYRQQVGPVDWRSARENEINDRALNLSIAARREAVGLVRRFGMPSGWTASSLGIRRFDAD